MKSKKRKRRRPEEARALILAAAQKVIGERGPDGAGLAAVAAEAGTSHALITHYFGTYDKLVEAVFEAQVRTERDQIAEAISRPGADPSAVLDVIIERLSQPKVGRLLAWAILAGRLESDDFFPVRERGAKLIADLLERALADSEARPSRGDIEAILVLVWCASLGYNVGRGVLWRALGREPNAQRDADFRAFLGGIVRGQLGAKSPTDR